MGIKPFQGEPFFLDGESDMKPDSLQQAEESIEDMMSLDDDERFGQIENFDDNLDSIIDCPM